MREANRRIATKGKEDHHGRAGLQGADAASHGAATTPAR
jgi:hypothetical protein